MFMTEWKGMQIGCVIALCVIGLLLFGFNGNIGKVTFEEFSYLLFGLAGSIAVISYFIAKARRKPIFQPIERGFINGFSGMGAIMSFIGIPLLRNFIF